MDQRVYTAHAHSAHNPNMADCWALCMYNEVAEKMLYEKCKARRLQNVFDYNRMIVRCALSHEDDVSLARRELVGFLLCRHFCTIIDARVIIGIALEILDMPEPSYIGTYVMMITATLGTTLPSTEHINYVLFNGHLRVSLEPMRCTRLNKELDIKMYKYLHMRLLKLRRVLLSEEIWSQWVKEGMNCFAMDMDIRQALTCVHIVYSNSHMRKLNAQLRCLRWRKQRKRKRQGTLVHAQCGICLDTMQVLQLPCTHHFCETCLNPCKTCPICRAKLR